MTVRMGYDFAMIRARQRRLAGAGITKTTFGQNGEKATERVLLSTVASYIAVQTVQLFSHKGG